MRKLIVSQFMSLDGVIQAPGGKDEDRDGGFEHGGWMMAYDERMDKLNEGEGVGGKWEPAARG